MEIGVPMNLDDDRSALEEKGPLKPEWLGESREAGMNEGGDELMPVGTMS